MRHSERNLAYAQKGKTFCPQFLLVYENRRWLPSGDMLRATFRKQTSQRSGSLKSDSQSQILFRRLNSQPGRVHSEVIVRFLNSGQRDLQNDPEALEAYYTRSLPGACVVSQATAP